MLKALADQCVRATFFVIGRKVDALPELARRELAEGHTLAHHTYSHPQPTLRYMGEARARADILKGMATLEHGRIRRRVPAGRPDRPRPVQTPRRRFFSASPASPTPPTSEHWFAANNVGTFGVDIWASDWVRMTPEQELKLILARLEKPKRGMLLFHDIYPWTAAMLPEFLRELKRRGLSRRPHRRGAGARPDGRRAAGLEFRDRAHDRRVEAEADAGAGASKPGPIEVKPAPEPDGLPR